MPTTGIARVVVSVADLDRALALYRDALGLTVRHRHGELAMLALDDRQELLLHQRTPQPSRAGVAVSFLVDDVDAVTDAAVRAGATVLDPPADQPWGERQSVVADPDGHPLCLVGRAGAAG